MRYQAFGNNEAPLDRQPCEFPWNPEVTFHIWRSGRRAFADRAGAQQMERMPRLISWIATKRNLTVAQIQGGDIDLEQEWKEAMEDMPMAEAMEQFGPEIVGLSEGPDIEGIALYLVERVDGPLILADDSEKVLGWHDKAGETKHLGIAFLEAMPDEMAGWIVEQATRIELEFQAFVEAASKNLPTTSANSAEGEGAETS